MQLKISLVHCLLGPNYRLLGGNYGLVAANDSLAPANHKMIRCGKGEMRLARAFAGDFNPFFGNRIKTYTSLLEVYPTGGKGYLCKVSSVCKLMVCHIYNVYRLSMFEAENRRRGGAYLYQAGK